MTGPPLLKNSHMSIPFISRGVGCDAVNSAV